MSDAFDVSAPDVNVIETRVVGLAGGKALVTMLDAKGDLTGAVVSCKY